jgi:hypothetical protein
MSANSSAPRPSRWYVPTPAKFLVAVLVVQSVLYLSAGYRWFWFNHHKGYTVLITVAATAILLVLLALAVGISQFFKTKAQFSLATLLLMVPVMAIPCGWLAKEVADARELQELTKTMSGSGGVDERLLLIGRRMTPVKPKRSVLDDWLGEYFLKDADWKYVTLGGKIPNGVRLLKKLERLECHSATDADLAYLRGLDQLYRVDVSGSQITDAGLRPLGDLPALQILLLNDTNITGDGLRNLRGLKHIHHIGLDDTPMTDAGLKHLGEIGNLQTLWLKRTKVTDAGLQHLFGLKKLRIVLVSETAVTADGAAALEKTVPGCVVDQE